MRGKLSKKAVGDQHGIFQHFQSNTTDYATRERYLSLRGGEKSLGRDTDSLYNIAPEGDESKVPTEYVAPHLSTRYSPDRVGVQAQRVADGVYQDPYTNKVYDYNEGFKTEDGRSFPGGSASLQSSLMRMATILDSKGLVKHANNIDSVLRTISASFIPSPIDEFRAKITGGRFEGGKGLVTHKYNDGVFGLDLDEPMHGSPRGFAKEEELEREDLDLDVKSNMSLQEVISELIEAHRDPATSFKISPERVREIQIETLTQEEKDIIAEGQAKKISTASIARSLVVIANTLDGVGLSDASDELDKAIIGLAKESELKAESMINLASSLDERGYHDIANLIDSGLSKIAPRRSR